MSACREEDDCVTPMWCRGRAQCGKVAKRVLRLTLKRRWFEMVASGVKKEEYREEGPWILSRLIGKEYDVVEFSNGYGAGVPKVTVAFLGWARGRGRAEWGADPEAVRIIIHLGEVMSNDQRQATASKKL